MCGEKFFFGGGELFASIKLIKQVLERHAFDILLPPNGVIPIKKIFFSSPLPSHVINKGLGNSGIKNSSETFPYPAKNLVPSDAA